MSKDKNKLKAKKRRNFSNTSASLGKNQQRSKFKKVTRPSGDDGISKSKQLAQKMETNRSIGRPKTRSTKSNNNEEPRVCGNGTPMPSLPELKKMFEDSDEEEVKGNTNNVPRFVSNGAHWPTFSDLEKMFEESDDDEDKTVNTLDITVPDSANGCLTPKTTLTISENNLKSPTTIKTIANKMLDYISNLPDPTVLIDETPHPAVVPPKKRKKPKFPYIVGCKDRDKVEFRPKTSFCKGDEEYGVDRNNIPDEEDECLKKRAKRGKAVNISKSIFNAKSDEIAARLKENESALSDESSDSISVAYQYYTPPSSDRSQSFSPLPSTSRDSEVIKENDIRFNHSYSIEQPPNEKDNNSVKVINNPPDTIIIDDEIVNTTPIVINSAVIEIDDSQDQVQLVNNAAANDLLSNKDDDYSCVEIIECNNNTNASRTDSPIPVDDYYSSLDLNQPFSNEDVTEIVDVDDVIAENNALIDKYRNSNNLDTVTSVEPSANKISLTSSMTQTIGTSIEPSANNIENLGLSVTQDTGTEIEHKNNTDCELVKKGSTDKYILRQYAVPVNDETIMEIDYLYRPGQPTSPVLEISNMPINGSQNERNNTINKRVRDSSMDAGNVAGNQSDTHQSETRCVILRSTNDPVVCAQRKKYKRCPPANFSTSIPVPIQIQTEPLPAEKGLGDCPICMDRLTKHPVASTICGHLFCLKCITAAVKASGKKCPSCRKPFRGVGFHQLFI